MLLSLHRIFRKIRYRKGISIIFVFGLFLFSIFGNAICFYIFDGPIKNINFFDAIWYSIISITTIGYGDLSAQTVGARIGTIFFTVLIGLGTFGVITGMIIDWVSQENQKGIKGMSKPMVDAHVIIVNFPNEFRIRQIINEIRNDKGNNKREIVIISDDIDCFDINIENVFFVKGSVLDRETYKKASVEKAIRAIVLATAYDDPNSDAIVSSAVAVIEGINRNVRTVAECLSDKHIHLFNSAFCDAVVCGMNISSNLLVQEAQDPGVGRVIDMITSNRKGTTIYSTTVKSSIEVSYFDIATNMFSKGMNILGINRDNKTYTPDSFMKMNPKPSDQLVYVWDRRITWKDVIDEIYKEIYL